MKLAAKIFAILGAIAIIGLGARWLHDYSAHKKLIDDLSDFATTSRGPSTELRDALAQLRDLRTAGVLAVLCGPISLVGVPLLGRRPWLAALLFIIGALVPAMFASKMYVPGSLLVIAAGLAIGATRRRPARPAVVRPELTIAA
jgi:hypothetical protein